jgi:hypothetical protein
MSVEAKFAEQLFQMIRQILIQFNLHRIGGIDGTGRSSSADAAANAIAARMSSIVRVGKSASISSAPSPTARLASAVRNVTSVPRQTGSPPQMLGSRIMRSA